jgi:ribonuclease VapC
MNEDVILDASAVLSVLNKEPGHKNVEEVLTHAILSSVNFAEVITVLAGIGMTVQEAEEVTLSIIKETVPFDDKQASISASLRKATKQYGLSFGDRACLALAKSHGSLVFTADKIWVKLNIPGVKIHLIR